MSSVLFFVALAIFCPKFGGVRVAIGAFLAWSLLEALGSGLPFLGLLLLLVLKTLLVVGAFLIIDRFEDTIVLSLVTSIVGALIVVSVPEFVAGALFGPRAKPPQRVRTISQTGPMPAHLAALPSGRAGLKEG